MHTKPVALLPVTVEKPWGREIWYSGIEARGESCVRAGNANMPLSRFLDEHGRTKPVTLLKMLHATVGNLYIEVHATKSEIYAVQQAASGSSMLLGVQQAKRRALGDAGLRSALLAAAQAAEAGTGSLRAVEALLNAVQLHPGDVVAIPAQVPHSLRRGAVVVEFQTPVFERKILAAEQPVATQKSWDCAAAAAMMDLTTVPVVERGSTALYSAPDSLPNTDFRLVRIAAGGTAIAPPWSVGWVFHGAVESNGCRFGARTAFLTPAQTRLSSSADAVALLAVEVETPVA